VYFSCPYSVNGHGDDMWKKVAQAIGNLQSLKSLRIFSTAHHESLTDLLRVPSLRSVCFHHFGFTTALCQATANALMEGTAITGLEFNGCSFPTEGSAAIMANGLARNTSVTSIYVLSPFGGLLYKALASALPSNSTLQHLELSRLDSDGGPDLSSFFLALGKNTGLETVKAYGLGSMDESLCTAIKDGLRMNERLESLELNRVHLSDDNSALWCRAFSFLRINKTLKSLLVDVHYGVTESCLPAFRFDIVAVLKENTSLESLSIRNGWNRTETIKAEEYIALVAVIQHNTTLKTFSVLYRNLSLRLTDDKDKQMATLLKKNYALESLPDIDLDNEAGDVGAILRLNGAGRRYLIEDGFSISKGVEVLSRVNNDINCVFLHLLENPRLCDRSAVEIVSTTDEINGRSSSSPNVSSGGGMREQAGVHKGKESRRRLV
jgi:hypothetical protein